MNFFREIFGGESHNDAEQANLNMQEEPLRNALPEKIDEFELPDPADYTEKTGRLIVPMEAIEEMPSAKKHLQEIIDQLTNEAEQPRYN